MTMYILSNKHSRAAEMKLQNIKKIYSENTGGGCIVDFLELENGLLLAISDEYIGLYDGKDEFYDGDGITGFWLQRSLYDYKISKKERYLEKLKDEILKLSGYFTDFDTDSIVQQTTGVSIKIENDHIFFKYDDGVANIYDWKIQFFLSYDLLTDFKSFLNLSRSSIDNFMTCK